MSNRRVFETCACGPRRSSVKRADEPGTDVLGGRVMVFMPRARRRRAVEAPEVVLPITPMLDMAFQLLFFFIAIYRPPTIREVQMELSLLPLERPPAESQETKAAEPGQPPDPNPRVALKPYDLTLMLETRIE